jgi:hypothetical protein
VLLEVDLPNVDVLPLVQVIVEPLLALTAVPEGKNVPQERGKS